MFLQLGLYVFEGIKLPETWGMNFATEFAEIPIIGGKPVLQKTGEKLIEHDITAKFSDEYCTPKTEVAALDISRKNGEILQLTGGDGTNYGRYVITDLQVQNVRASANGYVSAVTVSFKLKEYNSTATTVEQNGTALANNKPTEEIPVSPMISLPGSITNDINSGIETTSIINTKSKSSIMNFAKISSLANSATGKFNAANTKIDNTEKVIYRAANLQTSLTAASNAAQSVQDAADISNLNDLLLANDLLQASVYSLKGATAPVAAFVGSREGGK